MPRKEGQKRKLLVLLEILARETDEKHPLSVPQLVEELQEHGVVAERKSVYDDILCLQQFGMDIVTVKGRMPCAASASRMFCMESRCSSSDCRSNSSFKYSSFSF